MTKYRVPIRVGVAPVQTYTRTVTIEAESRKKATELIRSGHFVSDLIHKPGWRSVGGRMESTRPDFTAYETYLDEFSLDRWATEPDDA